MAKLGRSWTASTVPMPLCPKISLAAGSIRWPPSLLVDGYVSRITANVLTRFLAGLIIGGKADYGMSVVPG
jgi:hypothetical protein